MYQIVFVEDDPELAQLIADFLARHDMQVHIEPRGDTARACIEDRQPDLGPAGYHAARAGWAEPLPGVTPTLCRPHHNADGPE